MAWEARNKLKIALKVYIKFVKETKNEMSASLNQTFFNKTMSGQKYDSMIFEAKYCPSEYQIRFFLAFMVLSQLLDL